MIALMKAVVLTSPLLALKEGSHSFCGVAPLSVVQEQVWGQTLNLVL